MKNFSKFLETLQDEAEAIVDAPVRRKVGRPRLPDDKLLHKRPDPSRLGKRGRVRPSQRKKKMCGKYMMVRKNRRKEKAKHRANGYHVWDAGYRKGYYWNYDHLRRIVIRQWLHKMQISVPDTYTEPAWKKLKKTDRNKYWNDNCPMWQLSFEEYKAYWESLEYVNCAMLGDKIIGWVDGHAPSINQSIDKVERVKPFKLTGKRLLTLTRKCDTLPWQEDNLQAYLNKVVINVGES